MNWDVFVTARHIYCHQRPALDASTAVAIRTAINRAFVFGFRLIMLACVTLATASGAVALLFPMNSRFERPVSDQLQFSAGETV